ncbi:MAG: GNAT family N-acetyltransferase [Acidimicrobiales bacterium]
MIRPARASDVEAMQRVGAAAGRRFAEIDDPRIAGCADDPLLPTDALHRWVDDGRAWVAETAQAQVVGAIVVDVLDGNAHVEEVSVVPEAERRGIGSDLLGAVLAYAECEGHPAVTLTTFADVPWNRPWYERRGFTVLAPGEIGPELAARMRREADDGLDPALRVAMRRPVAG